MDACKKERGESLVGGNLVSCSILHGGSELALVYVRSIVDTPLYCICLTSFTSEEQVSTLHSLGRKLEFFEFFSVFFLRAFVESSNYLLSVLLDGCCFSN